MRVRRQSVDALRRRWLALIDRASWTLSGGLKRFRNLMPDEARRRGDGCRANRTACWPSRRQGHRATQYRPGVRHGLGGLAATISPPAPSGCAFLAGMMLDCDPRRLAAARAKLSL